MNVLEHPGPKGQIILASRDEPVWFSSARDAFSFTMLPEEPKDIRAIYVSDMAKAPSWDKPGQTNWVDARQALSSSAAACRRHGRGGGGALLRQIQCGSIRERQRRTRRGFRRKCRRTMC